MARISRTILWPLFLLATALVAGANVYADSHREAARELFAVMDMSTMTDQLIRQSVDMQLQQNPTLIPFKGVMEEFLQEYLSFESLQEDFVDVYIDTFSLDELKQMTAFYSTPVGAKALKVTPTLFQQGAEIGQRNVMGNMHVLQRRIKEKAEALGAATENN